MPTIDTPFLFDGLLVLIVLLFVPFGVRRGVAKEGFVSGGLLLGSLLAAAWAAEWADDLGGIYDLGQATSRLIIAVGFLAAGVLLLGYGGGAALGRIRQGILARIAGGLLAAVNATVLLGFLLAQIETYLVATGDAALLDDGVLAETLLREFDWVLLGAAGILAGLVLLGLVTTGIRDRRRPRRQLDPEETPPIAPRHRPVRLARDADAGKEEPGPLPEPRPGRFGGTGFGPVGSPAAHGAGGAYDRRYTDPTGSWPSPPPPADGGQTNGHGSSPSGMNDWSTHAGPIADPNSPLRPSADETFSRPERRCPSCQAVVGGNDVFCADCGLTLSSP